MSPFTVTLAAAGLLLLATGVVKVHRPAPAAGALLAAGWLTGSPRRALVAARLLGLLEVALAAGVLATGARGAAAAVAAAYAGFAGFAVVGLRTRRMAASCGCAGRDDTPLGAGHVLLCAGFAGLAAAAAAWPGEPLPAALVLAPGAGTTLAGVGLAVLLAATGWVVLTDLPRLAAARSLR